MADLNKVFLMGRLTFDPELRRTPSGSAVTELRLATTRSWSGRDGERKEETLFIDVTVWERQAETCCQYLKKGRAVHVEGSLKMDSWDDKTTGEKRTKIKVQAERVQFLDSQRADGTGGSGGMAGDDEMAPPPRESGSRRGSAAPMRGPSGGYGEPRAPINGPTRPSYPAPGPPARRTWTMIARTTTSRSDRDAVRSTERRRTRAGLGRTNAPLGRRPSSGYVKSLLFENEGFWGHVGRALTTKHPDDPRLRTTNRKTLRIESPRPDQPRQDE